MGHHSRGGPESKIRRNIIKSAILSPIIFSGAALTAEQKNPIYGLSDNDKKRYDERQVVNFFTDYYGEKAGKIASITMDYYKKNDDVAFDPLLYLGQIRQESDFGNPLFMISWVGAAGPTQVMAENAGREPFNLDVFHNPEYYRKTREEYIKRAPKMRKTILQKENTLKNVSRNSMEKSEADIIEAVERDINFFDNNHVLERDSFARNFIESGGMDILFETEKGKQEYRNFKEMVKSAYMNYEDELGSMVYRGYRKGDVRKMRNRVIKPVEIRSQKELEEIDQRFVDEIIIPKSYKEMQRLSDKYENPLIAVAAYNCGEGNISNPRRLPRITETLDYVSWVFHNFNSFFKNLSPE